MWFHPGARLTFWPGEGFEPRHRSAVFNHASPDLAAAAQYDG